MRNPEHGGIAPIPEKVRPLGFDEHPSRTKTGRELQLELISTARENATGTETRFDMGLLINGLGFMMKIHEQDEGTNGEPYILHPLTDAIRVIKDGGNAVQATTALLKNTVKMHPDEVDRNVISAYFIRNGHEETDAITIGEAIHDATDKKRKLFKMPKGMDIFNRFHKPDSQKAA